MSPQTKMGNRTRSIRDDLAQSLSEVGLPNG
jgi:hypothetical protein